MILEDHEKKRFVKWLRTQAESSRGLAEEFKKSPGSVMEHLAKRESYMIAAYILVAKDLESREPMSIGDDDE